MAEEKDEEQTIAQDLVVTKYKMAAELVNGVYCVHYLDNQFDVFSGACSHPGS